jgi:hypothetical protein
MLPDIAHRARFSCSYVTPYLLKLTRKYRCKKLLAAHVAVRFAPTAQTVKRCLKVAKMQLRRIIFVFVGVMVAAAGKVTLMLMACMQQETQRITLDERWRLNLVRRHVKQSMDTLPAGAAARRSRVHHTDQLAFLVAGAAAADVLSSNEEQWTSQVLPAVDTPLVGGRVGERALVLFSQQNEANAFCPVPKKCRGHPLGMPFYNKPAVITNKAAGTCSTYTSAGRTISCACFETCTASAKHMDCQAHTLVVGGVTQHQQQSLS